MIFGAQTLLLAPKVDPSMWGETRKTMVYLLNRTYRAAVGRTPYEAQNRSVMASLPPTGVWVFLWATQLG